MTIPKPQAASKKTAADADNRAEEGDGGIDPVPAPPSTTPEAATVPEVASEAEPLLQPHQAPQARILDSRPPPLPPGLPSAAQPSPSAPAPSAALDGAAAAAAMFVGQATEATQTPTPSPSLLTQPPHSATPVQSVAAHVQPTQAATQVIAPGQHGALSPVSTMAGSYTTPLVNFIAKVEEGPKGERIYRYSLGPGADIDGCFRNVRRRIEVELEDGLTVQMCLQKRVHLSHLN